MAGAEDMLGLESEWQNIHYVLIKLLAFLQSHSSVKASSMEGFDQ